MLEGKFEKLKFQEMLSSPHWKIEMSKNKTKCWKKWTKRNGESKEKEKKERWIKKKQWKIIFHEMILGLITLKHNLGLFILSFETMNPGLHYVPKSPFRLNVDTWTEEVFSLKDFCNQRGCCPFSSAKILDKSFTCLEWIFKCIIGQSKKMRKKMKKWL